LRLDTREATLKKREEEMRKKSMGCGSQRSAGSCRCDPSPVAEAPSGSDVAPECSMLHNGNSRTAPTAPTSPTSVALSQLSCCSRGGASHTGETLPVNERYPSYPSWEDEDHSDDTDFEVPATPQPDSGSDDHSDKSPRLVKPLPRTMSRSHTETVSYMLFSEPDQCQPMEHDPSSVDFSDRSPSLIRPRSRCVSGPRSDAVSATVEPQDQSDQASHSSEAY
jgi:hypothetical protein